MQLDFCFLQAVPKKHHHTSHQASWLDYSIIQYKPCSHRLEAVNIGIVLFTESGPVLEFSKNMNKINSLDADVSWNDIYHQIQEIEQATRLLLEAKVSTKDLIAFLSRDRWEGVQYSHHRTIPIEGRTAQGIIFHLMQKFVFPLSRKNKG